MLSDIENTIKQVAATTAVADELERISSYRVFYGAVGSVGGELLRGFRTVAKENEFAENAFGSAVGFVGSQTMSEGSEPKSGCGG